MAATEEKALTKLEKARLLAAAEAPKIIKKLAEKAKAGNLAAAKIVLEIAGLLPKGKGAGSGNVALQVVVNPKELKALENDPALRKAIDVTSD